MLMVLYSMSWVMNPTPKGRSVWPRIWFYLFPQPLGAEVVGAAKGAEAPGQRDRRGQPAAAVVAHGGGHHWKVKAEQVGETGLQHD